MRTLKTLSRSSYRSAELDTDLASPHDIGDPMADERRFQNAPNLNLPVNDETGLREAGHYRHTIHDSELALVENSSVSPFEPSPSGFESRHQVVLPYFGLFDYRVGSRSALVDTNCTLFVTPDREYHDVHPVEGVGHAGVVINPSMPVLEELCASADSANAFSEMSRGSTPRLRLLTHFILRTFPSVHDRLLADEWTIAALKEALGVRASNARRASRVISQAKMILHDRGCERLSLTAIAREVGVSGVYLTQEFTRVEGIPLYRYQLMLRLNRALLELPHCDDITRLALDLGFSSHSHFTSAFRRNFGVTPSAFRLGRLPFGYSRARLSGPSAPARAN
jgi:AraC family transcriptional regulator